MNSFARQYDEIAPEGCVEKYFLQGTFGPLQEIFFHTSSGGKPEHVCDFFCSKHVNSFLTDILEF